MKTSRVVTALISLHTFFRYQRKYVDSEPACRQTGEARAEYGFKLLKFPVLWFWPTYQLLLFLLPLTRQSVFGAVRSRFR